MAIVIAYVFGLVLHDYTGLSLTGSWFNIDPVTGQRYLTLQNLILPALTLGIRPLINYYTTDKKFDAGHTQPGLYKNGLCKRVK